MAAELAGVISGALLEAQLPSKRWVVLQGFDLDETVPGDPDRGTIEDVGARVVDFAAVAGILQEVGQLLKDVLRPLRPSEVAVDIGLSVSVKTGRVLVLFGEAAAEATVKVTLKWDLANEPADDSEA